MSYPDPASYTEFVVRLAVQPACVQSLRRVGGSKERRTSAGNGWKARHPIQAAACPEALMGVSSLNCRGLHGSRHFLGNIQDRKQS